MRLNLVDHWQIQDIQVAFNTFLRDHNLVLAQDDDGIYLAAKADSNPRDIVLAAVCTTYAKELGDVL